MVKISEKFRIYICLLFTVPWQLICKTKYTTTLSVQILGSHCETFTMKPTVNLNIFNCVSFNCVSQNAYLYEQPN